MDQFDPKQIKAIAFDLGNVLLPFSRWKAVSNIAHVAKKNPLLIALHFVLYPNWQDFDRGRFTPTEFYEIMKKGLGLKISEQEFTRAFADMFRENTGVINLLPLLKKRFKLLLLSDINPVHATHCFEKYRFFNIFDAKILSYQVKAKKPSPEIFAALTQAAGLNSREILFIDDKISNVWGAQKFGLESVQFRGEDRLAGWFEKMGFLTEGAEL